MSVLKLFYTGWFGKKGNSSGNKELKIDGDCTITNYDTRTNNKPDAYVKVRTYNNSIFVEEGSKSDKTPNVADFSEKKAIVLEELANLDSTDSGLSKKDISKISQNRDEYKRKWGLAELRVDPDNGVLTLKWGDNDILRIDFSMKTNSVEPEELNKSNNATPKVHVVQSGDTLSSIAEKYGIGLQRLKDANADIEDFDKLSLNQKIIIPADTSKISSPTNVSSSFNASTSKANVEQNSGQKKANSFNDLPITDKPTYGCAYKIKAGDLADNISKNLDIPLIVLRVANKHLNLDQLSIGDIIIIPERESVENTRIKDLSTVAKVTGLSEYYIKEVLTKIEQKHNTVYDDKVGGGTLTIGYGHAGRLLGKYFEEGTNSVKQPGKRFVLPKQAENNSKIINLSDEEIYQILAQDLLNAKSEAIAYFGESFEQAPQEIQDGIIDIIFNKGIEKGFANEPSSLLKKDLENKNYISAVKHLIYKTSNNGLQKRNLYRIINATKFLSDEDRINVMNSLTSYYENVKANLKAGTANDLEIAWENARKGIYGVLSP